MAESNTQWVPLEDPELNNTRAPRSRRFGVLVLASAGIAAFAAIAIVTHSSAHERVKATFNDAARANENPIEPAARASDFAQADTVEAFNELFMISIVEDPKAMYAAMPTSLFAALLNNFLATMGTEVPDASGNVPAPSRSYSSHIEHEYRLGVFRKNIFNIIQANHEEYVRNPTAERARFGITVHVDWTEEEFVMTRLNLKATDTSALFSRAKPNPAKEIRSQVGNVTAFGSPTELAGQCEIETGGRCYFLPCHASRGAQCFEHECICIDGSCAEDGACVRPGNCQVATGGSCHILPCDSSRGATCVNGDCICAQGTCAVDGKCVSQKQPDDDTTGIDCSSVTDLGDVRNQGSCGDCWAFSTAQQLRYMTIKKYETDPGTMSVQYLVDCMPEVAEASCSEGVKGCCGGLPYRADLWLKESGGLPTQDDYGPLKSDKHPNQAYECHSAPKKVKVIGNPEIYDTEKEIANAYCKKGPIAIAINANSALQHYTGGVMNVQACPPSGINHAVLYVGVTKNYDNGNPVHIVLNSWGANWGVNTQSTPYRHRYGTPNGHVLFKYGENVCNIEALASAPGDVELL